jgi:hypothetical protein
MNLHKRLEKLERLAKPAARKVPTRDMTGVAWKELLNAVGESIDAADEDLAKEILRLVAEAAKVPWHNLTTKEKYLDDQGQEIPTPHYFVIWLWGLEVGSWRLPPRLSREILQGFCRPYGAVLCRCEDCLAAFGNNQLFTECPVCHGSRLSCKYLAGPPWDPAWVYTPHPNSCPARG